MDDQTDTPRAPPEGRDTDDRWMSYRELGLSRGISRASAARLAHRHRWHKRTDNDGTVRVLVPHGLDAPADRHPADVHKGRDADIPGMSRAISALETAIAALRERAEAAEQGRDGAIARADRADARADELRTRLEALQAQLATAQAATQRLQELEAADAARKAAGLLARLRAAVRGR